MSVIYKNGTYYGAGGGGGSADTEIIADDFDPTESYAVGAYVVYEGILYKCTTAHTGDWDASDFEDTQVMAEMPTPMPSADMSEVVSPLPGVMSRTKIYSPEEQVVGEWRETIDGVLKKKPVYEKVVAGTTPSSSGTWQQSTTIDSNMDMCVGIISFVKLAEGYYFSNYSASDFLTKVNNGALYFIVTNTFASKPVHTILQYTKTTDEWEVV